jgi:hypothetical protein
VTNFLRKLAVACVILYGSARGILGFRTVASDPRRDRVRNKRALLLLAVLIGATALYLGLGSFGLAPKDGAISWRSAVRGFRTHQSQFEAQAKALTNDDPALRPKLVPGWQRELGVSRIQLSGRTVIWWFFYGPVEEIECIAFAPEQSAAEVLALIRGSRRQRIDFLPLADRDWYYAMVYDD